MITLRGLFFVSRTGDDPPCVDSKRFPCVDSKRPRVYRHHAHMLKHMCAWCRHTRGRFECTHGGVFESTHGFFSRFSACRNTHKHTHKHTQRPTTTPHGDRDRERQRKRDKTREDETRRDKRREKREDERQEKRR